MLEGVREFRVSDPEKWPQMLSLLLSLLLSRLYSRTRRTGNGMCAPASHISAASPPPSLGNAAGNDLHVTRRAAGGAEASFGEAGCWDTRKGEDT